ncbi:MAG TPA: HNH endonuclease [bacterium]|nr:HNH endonuclease [bacterium]
MDTFTCELCKKEFQASPFRGRRKRQFCSQPCARKKIGSEQRGKNNPMWKGGVHFKKGYKYFLKPEHPGASKQGYVAEHRFVMEKKLGRYLTRKEVVHHKNEIRSDNRIENLILMGWGEHLSIHHKGKKLTKKHKRQLSEFRTGTKMPEEIKKKISETMKEVRKKRFWSSKK